MADIVFTGTGTFAQEGAETITRSADGTEVRTRVLVGDAANLASAESAWKVGTRHPDNPALFVRNQQIESTGGRCALILTFTGREGADNSAGGAALVGRTLAARSAAITKNSSSVDYIVQYLSPVATVTWVSRTDVSAPQKSALAGIDSETVQVIAAHEQPSGAPIDNVTSAFTKDTDYQLVTVYDGFQTTPLGKVDGVEQWSVTETWTRVMENI